MLNFAKNSVVFLKIIFILCLIVLSAISYLVFTHISNLKDSTTLVLHTYEINVELSKIESYLKDAETGHRGYLLTADSTFLDSYLGTREKVNNTFARLKQLTFDNSTQQNNLKDLNSLIDKRFSNFNLTLPFAEAYANDSQNNEGFLKEPFLKGKMVMDQIRLKVDQMQDLENILLENREIQYKKTITYTPLILTSVLIFTMALFIIAYFKIYSDLKSLKKKNDELLVSQESSNVSEIISNHGTWLWDVETNAYNYSDNLYRLLGVEPQSFQPCLENFIKFVHPEDINGLNEDVDRMMIKKDLPFTNYRIIRQDGEIRHLKAFGRSFINAEGRNRLIGITSDITDEYNKNELIKNNLEQLKEANAELRIFDESSKQAEILGEYGSWILNYDSGKFSYSDNKFRLMGCVPQSFDPSIEKLLEFVHPEDKEIVINGKESVLKTGTIPTMNYRIIRADGEIRNFKTIAKSYQDSSGRKSMIGTTADVTDEIENLRKLEERNFELLQNNNELSAFNYVASHDLQEPLRKIQTFISRLDEKEATNLSENGKVYLDRIKSAASRMRLLIDDLLQYSRTNKSEKVFINTDLNELLENAQQDVAEIIEEKQATIKADNLPNIFIIPFQIQQLFLNLLSNSLKYSKENIPPNIKIKYVKVRAKDEHLIKKPLFDSYHKITFIDNGIGFDQEYAERIFILFSRLHEKGEFSGTGIGLSICKKIVENHKGFIFAEGEVNIGSIFTIYLPVK